MKTFLKPVIEIGPLVLFFLVNAKAGIFVATQVFMVTIVISLSLSYYLDRRIAIMPLVTGIVVLIFGGLTIYLENDLFIKLKPTIVNLLFAAILAGGLIAGKPFLQIAFGSAFQLTASGWRTLTLRWAGFFVVMAVLNEIVWRNFTTDFWISYKLLGALPLTVVFALSQTPLLLRHQTVAEEPADPRVDL